jgi:hypothetical protein
MDRIGWEILNATADDCENLDQIFRQVCFDLVEPSSGEFLYRPIPAAPTLCEIAERIRTLVADGWLEAVMDENGAPLPATNDISYVWRAWFQMTDEGKREWESAAPLNDAIT